MSQQSSLALRSIGEVLYLNEEQRDLTVIVKDEVGIWKFPAHKLVLASESPILRAKLEDENLTEIVLDFEPSTAELLLRFVYQGKLNVENWDECLKLLEAAFKLEIQDLVQKCGGFLEKVITLSNVCYIYNVASCCSLVVLQDKCLKLILDAGFIVLKSSAFEILNKDCVMDVISSSELNIDSELTVFETLFRWARIECCRSGLPITEANKLTQIKPFLQHVCIDDMSDADKSDLPPNILSCVKPNNRNRIEFSIQDSLLLHSLSLELEHKQSSFVPIGLQLSCFRFSIDSPVHLLGIHFTISTLLLGMEIPLILVKENTPKVTVCTHNLRFAEYVSIQYNQNVCHNGEVKFDKPELLKAGDVYNFYMCDPCSTDAECSQTELRNKVLKTSRGHINFTVHSEQCWAITRLILI